MADLLLQAEPDLAGGVILGAGHLYKAKPMGQTSRSKKTKGKGRPVFIGVGRLDGNYPFGLRAVLHHRSAGARTTFEAWRGLAHAFPQDGSTALQQWFCMRLYPELKLRPVAQKEMQSELDDALKLEPYTQWIRLSQLRDYPYSQILGEDWKTNSLSLLG